MSALRFAGDRLGSLPPLRPLSLQLHRGFQLPLFLACGGHKGDFVARFVDLNDENARVRIQRGSLSLRYGGEICSELRGESVGNDPCDLPPVRFAGASIETIKQRFENDNFPFDIFDNDMNEIMRLIDAAAMQKLHTMTPSDICKMCDTKGGAFLEEHEEDEVLNAFPFELSEEQAFVALTDIVRNDVVFTLAHFILCFSFFVFFFFSFAVPFSSFLFAVPLSTLPVLPSFSTFLDLARERAKAHTPEGSLFVDVSLPGELDPLTSQDSCDSGSSNCNNTETATMPFELSPSLLCLTPFLCHFCEEDLLQYTPCDGKMQAFSREEFAQIQQQVRRNRRFSERAHRAKLRQNFESSENAKVNDFLHARFGYRRAASREPAVSPEEAEAKALSVLHLSAHFSKHELLRRFAELAKQTHPDTACGHGGHGSAEEFRQVFEAFQTLRKLRSL
ncbi:MAG: hypothetical protein MHM6MM_005251 [Cercozoa sp. M6MM]